MASQVTVAHTPFAIIRTIEKDYPIANETVFSTLNNEWKSVRRASASELRDRSQGHLKTLGLTERDLDELANAGLIEVRFAPTATLAMNFPWELVLTLASEAVGSQPILVVRHLDQNIPNRETTVPERLAVVKSSPGFLSEWYSEVSFETEEDNVAANIGLTTARDIWNFTLEELASRLTSESPHVIHLTGIDNSEAKELAKEASCTIQEQQSLEKASDYGMVFKSAIGLPVGVAPDDLARAICISNEAAPILTTFNFYNTSPLAAAAVRHGSRFSIGYQGRLDDVYAEIFFCNFYLAWKLAKWRILDAFRLAIAELREALKSDSLAAKASMAGRVVLWSGTSLLDLEQRARLRKKSQSLVLPDHSLQKEFDKVRDEEAVQPSDEVIATEIIPRRALNFSLLHNDRSLFHQFYLRKIPALGQLKGVRVEVSLFAGGEQFVYSARRDMKYTLWLLENEVRIPLTSRFAKSVRESINASLLVKIHQGDKPRYEKTFRVILLPIDQWQDDEENRQWLPSFVLPRDPAVSRIVDCAQKYLCAITDDATSGFDGYQSSADDGVTSQVQALWYALAHEHSLSYVNPPPSFTEKSQRLRKPFDVIEGRRGTCIDLAIVLASCLEYIDVYPTVFLLEGHAFVGYYRTEEAHREVRHWVTRDGGADDQDAWMLGKNFYTQILELVNRGEIVPLEPTLLTKRGGFWDSVEEGTLNLSNPTAFNYMIDIRLARQNGVTPLPLWDQE